MDYKALILISGTLLFLVLATILVESFRKYRDYGLDTSILDTCRSRLRGWWLLFGGLTCALLVGPVATVLFFGLISFWALREYITLTPTRPADHRTLVWIFFLCTPLQFVLIGINDNWFRSVFGIGTYSVYSVLLPAYAFLILPASIAVSGDPKFFLERIAKIQVGLVICVYSLSFVPALLTTNLPVKMDPAVTSELFAEGLEDRLLTPFEKALSNGNQKSYSAQSGSNSGNDLERLASPKDVLIPYSLSKGDKKVTKTNGTDKTSAKKNSTAKNVESDNTSTEINKMNLKNGSEKEESDEKKPNETGDGSGREGASNSDGPDTKSTEVSGATLAEVSPFFAEPVSSKKVEMPRKTLTSVNLSLLFTFVLLVQMSDIFQYLWSALLKGHQVAPTINSNRTWEGVFCGALSTSLLAVGLWYFTPFPFWWQAALCGLVISLMGFAGSITMSAIKRDRGVADYGTLVEGHNGVLDRMDSLCFAAPVFYHLVWILLNLD